MVDSLWNKNISVLLWDFDGTLFPPNEAFQKELIEADYLLVMNHTGWTREKTIEEFHKIYKVTTPSSTETAAQLSHISVAQAAIECEDYKDRTKYLSVNIDLQMLFRKLRKYQHFMLANGITSKLLQALEVLGIPSNTFSEIVTSETVGVNKPQLAGFQYILKKTGLPPDEHLMIGDREAVDLVPAKSLGMKTALVWSETKSEIADVTCKTVYDITNVLG